MKCSTCHSCSRSMPCTPSQVTSSSQCNSTRPESSWGFSAASSRSRSASTSRGGSPRGDAIMASTRSGEAISRSAGACGAGTFRTSGSLRQTYACASASQSASHGSAARPGAVRRRAICTLVPRSEATALLVRYALATPPVKVASNSRRPTFWSAVSEVDITRRADTDDDSTLASRSGRRSRRSSRSSAIVSVGSPPPRDRSDAHRIGARVETGPDLQLHHRVHARIFVGRRSHVDSGTADLALRACPEPRCSQTSGRFSGYSRIRDPGRSAGGGRDRVVQLVGVDAEPAEASADVRQQHEADPARGRDPELAASPAAVPVGVACQQPLAPSGAGST